MRIFSKLRQFVQGWDLFCCGATLRVRSGSQHLTLFGGFISLALVVFFAGIFWSRITQVATFSYISSSSQNDQDLNSTDSINGMLFAIGLKDVNLSLSTQNYFSVSLRKNIYVNYAQRPTYSSQIPLRQCQQADWSSLGQQFKDSYSIYKISGMLCPDSNYSIQVTGTQSQTTYQNLQLSIRKCSNFSSNNTCSSDADINSYFNNQTNPGDFVRTRLLFLDTNINGNSNTPVQKVIRRNINLPFTSSSGVIGYVYISQYEVTTDNSIFPYEYQKSETGYYINNVVTTNIPIISTNYITLTIQKSPQKLTVSRTHGKLDQTLSYIGGLFGLIFSLCMFFVGSYSEYCYELHIAQTTFKTNQNTSEKSFGFISFLGLKIYQFLKFLRIQPNWKRMKEIDQAKEQINQQMDVRLLMKKLNYLQSLSETLLEEHQRMSLYLAEAPTIQNMKQIRQLFQNTQKNIQDKSNNFGNRVQMKSEFISQPKYNKDIHNLDISSQHFDAIMPHIFSPNPISPKNHKKQSLQQNNHQYIFNADSSLVQVKNNHSSQNKNSQIFEFNNSLTHLNNNNTIDKVSPSLNRKSQ